MKQTIRRACLASAVLAMPCASATAEPGLTAWEAHRDAVISDPDLVACYDFQDGEGERLSNASTIGGELDGIIQGATWTEGRWPGKGALAFDGRKDQVEIASHPALFPFGDAEGPGELTLSVSLYIESHAESGIVDKSSGGWGRDGPYATWISSTFLYGNAGDGENGVSARETTPAPLGSWIQLVFTIDDRNLTLYRDGRAVGRHARTLDPADNGLPLYIGSMGSGKFPFHGRIDEVAIYRRAFTAAEVYRYHRMKPIYTFWTLP